MIDVKYSIVFICATLLISCTKKDENQDSDMSNLENCQLEFANDVRLLDSSIEVCNFYESEVKLNYKDSEGIVHEFVPITDEGDLWCFHDWRCNEDPTQIDSFWAIRHVKNKTLTSITSNYSIRYFFYASLNEEEPLKYSDIFTIQVVRDDERTKVSTYVVDLRNDTSSSNSGLIEQDTVQYEDNTYENVFMDYHEEFSVIYNLEYGVIQLTDSINNVEFTLLK